LRKFGAYRVFPEPLQDLGRLAGVLFAVLVVWRVKNWFYCQNSGKPLPLGL
jgi:hypothetical protein